jgi:predicted DCC family thiol-disulfide oxidoreductase YuxK
MLPPTNKPETVFYDGSCGFCHRSVTFVVTRDRRGFFRFAPLFGSTFLSKVAEAERHDLPDSIVVLTVDGRILTRSAAALHIGRRLGGVWRLLAALGRIVPAFLRDSVYNAVARVRSRLFARPEGSCPLLPAELRARFDP